jgi:hypothetical protein
MLKNKKIIKKEKIPKILQIMNHFMMLLNIIQKQLKGQKSKQ